MRVQLSFSVDKTRGKTENDGLQITLFSQDYR